MCRNQITTIYPETFIENGDLLSIDLGRNSISHIGASTFRNNSGLRILNISVNNITSIDSETFNYNKELQSVELHSNSISDIHVKTFGNNSRLRRLDISGNNIALFNQTGLFAGMNLTHLDMSRNRIRYLDKSLFTKQGQLETLILSGNMLQSLGPDLFTDCTNLRTLYLSGNNISEISTSTFRGLEQLEHLDLSNNNIEELNPLIFEPFSISTNRHIYQVSKLKHLNLAHNKIRFFNFELYFQSNTSSETSDPTYELVSLNVSSNRLYSLDATSVRWLKHTAAVTDRSGNPWKCECSALGEAWWELRHKLTVNCASPEDRRGRTWDVIEEDLCHNRREFAKLSNTDNPNLKTSVMIRSSTAEPEIADEFPESDDTTTSTLFINERNGTSSLMTTILIVIGVLSGCVLVAGGIILAVVLKELRDSSNAPQNTNVYTPGVSDRQGPFESLIELNSKCDYAKQHHYETVT
jgi:hypothetical protein